MANFLQYLGRAARWLFGTRAGWAVTGVSTALILNAFGVLDDVLRSLFSASAESVLMLITIGAEEFGPLLKALLFFALVGVMITFGFKMMLSPFKKKGKGKRRG